MKLFKIVCVSFSLFFAGAVFSQSRAMGEILHGPQNNIITLASTYDATSNSVCVHAVLTRNGGGAASKISCYSSSTAPRFNFSKISELSHARTNILSVFKIVDFVNNYVCFGNAVTRSGNQMHSDRNGVLLLGANADLDLNCKSSRGPFSR